MISLTTSKKAILAIILIISFFTFGCHRVSENGSSSQPYREDRPELESWIETIDYTLYPASTERQLSILGKYPCPISLQEIHTDGFQISNAKDYLAIRGDYDLISLFFCGNEIHREDGKIIPISEKRKIKVIEQDLAYLLERYGAPDRVWYSYPEYGLFWFADSYAFGVSVFDCVEPGTEEPSATQDDYKLLWIKECLYFPNMEAFDSYKADLLMTDPENLSFGSFTDLLWSRR